jgi:hypothetical protein
VVDAMGVDAAEVGGDEAVRGDGGGEGVANEEGCCEFLGGGGGNVDCRCDVVDLEGGSVEREVVPAIFDSETNAKNANWEPDRAISPIG